MNTIYSIHIMNIHGRKGRPQRRVFNYKVIKNTNSGKVEILEEEYFLTQRCVTNKYGLSRTSIDKIASGKKVYKYPEYEIIKCKYT